MVGKHKKLVAAPVEEHSKCQRLAVSEPDEDDDPDDPLAPIDGYEFRTVKCSLRSICNNASRALPWESVLKDANKAVKEAYILANLHVVRLLQAGQPIPVLNKKFYYRILSAVSVGLTTRRRIANEDLRLSVELYRSWRDPDVPYANSGYISYGWLQNASREMATNAKNHIVINFNQRFDNYLKFRFRMTGGERTQLLRYVLAPTYAGSNAQVREFRDWIPRDRNGFLDTNCPHLILPLTYRFLRFIEEENFQHRFEPNFRELRSFSLLPHKKGFDCSHFNICKLGLWALLKRAGEPIPPLKADDGPVWNDIVDEYWYNLFAIRQFETRNCRFAGLIRTDGKAVSIVLRKPVRADPEVSFDPSQSVPGPNILNRGDFDEVWGLDPGRRNLFVATNNTGDTISCSSCEFYEDAKYTSSNKTIRYWYDHDSDVLEAMHNMPSRKTCSLLRLMVYVRFLIPCLDLLLNFHMAKPFRKLRFRRYVFMKRKLRQLCLKLTATAGKRTLVGFGDWSATDFGGLIKRCRPGGPVKKLENELKRYCTVAKIPEFRTSKLHAECHRELTYQYVTRRDEDGVECRVKVYSVLHCQHNGCHGMTVDRDKNASKNMLLLTQHYLQHRARHPAFMR